MRYMRNSGSAKIKAWAVLASLLASASCVIATGRALTSSFLTAPLPPEELHLARHGGDFVINGPTSPIGFSGKLALRRFRETQ